MMHTEFNGLKRWLLDLGAIAEGVTSADEIRRLDLSHRSIETLPPSFGLLENLMVLNLANNKLDALPESFASLQHLSNLDIRRNRFTQLPPLLASLPLRSLNASANKITDVTVLAQCSELRVVDLSANSIESVEGAFRPGNEIRTLNLSQNYIASLGEVLETFEFLERLNLSENVIRTIGPNMASMEELVSLDLSNNRIEVIDSWFYTLGLEQLDLSENRLRNLYLHGLEELDVLILDHNPLKRVSFDEAFAPYLRQLSCDECGLDEFVLPPSKSLETLSLPFNTITGVSDVISGYTSLSELDLEGNRVTELPRSMENLTRLQTLYLNGNPLSHAARDIIEVLHPDICDITMKTGIVIEEARETDLPEMAGLLSQLFAIEADFDIDYDKQLSGIAKLYENEGTDLLVARHEEHVIGMVTMQRLISSAEGDFVGQIEDLVVNDAYRKMGVGSRLINKMRFIAQEYGYKRIQLVADLDNDNAHRFYNRRGFRRTNLSVYHFING